MPRRLGDDPLSRKKSPSTKENDAPSARPGFSTQQASHNDVFFRRRTEGLQLISNGAPDQQPPSLGEARNSDEKPEITEVADIVRTAQAAKSTQGAELLARPAPIDESTHNPVEEPAEIIEQTPPSISEPIVSFESPPPITEGPAAPTSSPAEPDPHKSKGFFKRLFGRLGK